MSDDPEESLTLDDTPEENRQPLHIWTNPLHDSIDAMTARQRGSIATQPDAESDKLRDWWENEMLALGLPYSKLEAAWSKTEDVVFARCASAKVDAVVELMGKLGPEGAALRRVFLGEGVHRTTAYRRNKRLQQNATAARSK